MKKLAFIIVAAVAMVATGCGKRAASNEAASAVSISDCQAITVDSLLSNAASLVDSLVTVEGVCTHTCKHGARKIFLAGSDEGKTIRVEACEIGAFDPEVVNSLVKVTGYLREHRIDEEYIANWEEALAEVCADENAESGCESERTARGVESTTAKGQIAEYRQRIADNAAAGRDPWLSFYYIDAVDYEVEPES